MPSATAGRHAGRDVRAADVRDRGEGAKHADCAAFFLNWVATNKQARTIGVQVGGSRPMGPADAYMPAVDPDTVTAETLAAGAKIGTGQRRDGLHRQRDRRDLRQELDAQLQKLVAGQQTPQGMLTEVQKDYESEIGS